MTSPGKHARGVAVAEPVKTAFATRERARTLPIAMLKRAVREARGAVGATQTEFARIVGTHQQIVAAQENPHKPHLPTLGHITLMPDASLDVLLHEVARIRAERGHAMRRWVEVASDERAEERGSRAALLAETVRHLSAVIATLSAQVAEMQKGRDR